MPKSKSGHNDKGVIKRFCIEDLNWESWFFKKIKSVFTNSLYLILPFGVMYGLLRTLQVIKDQWKLKLNEK